MTLASLIVSLAAYGAGSAAALRALRAGNPRGLCGARLCALAGVLSYVAHGAWEVATAGRLPVADAAEAFAFLSAASVAAALALDWARRLSILTVATLPLGAATSALALALWASSPPGKPAVPGDAMGTWTVLHVLVALASYGAFALAFVTGVLYLVEHRQLKHHGAGSILGFLPALETVQRLNVRAMAVGALLLLAGLLVGYFQARELYRRQFDRLDPKILLTTLTFLTYAAILVLSARPAFKGRRTALGSLLGFGLLMINFWASVFWSDLHRFR
jgi:ABC-type uncharacterized transport system permease subunit